MMSLKRLSPVCLSLYLLFACQAPNPNPVPVTSPVPSPTATPVTASPTPARSTAALAGCWQDPASGRRQYYTAIGSETLDLRLVVGSSERLSKVRLKADGFLEIIGEPSLGETLEWVGEQLIFRINGSQVAAFSRCPQGL